MIWVNKRNKFEQLSRNLAEKMTDKQIKVQVNICQKLLFLHQLTHNMTTDCSLNYKFSIHENSKLRPGENMLCTEIVFDIQNNFCTQHVLPMFQFGSLIFWTCNLMNNLTLYCVLVDAKIRAFDQHSSVICTKMWI